MGVVDKLINFMKLNEEEDYYDEDDYMDDEDDMEPMPPSRRSSSSKVRDIDDYEDDRTVPMKRQTAAPSKITPIKQSSSRKMSGGNNMEVCVIKPVSVEDAREITETLLANRTVVLNLEGLDVDIAQRIIDFTSGSCYAISGNLQKISHYIFIITPASVDISGDFQDIFNDCFEKPINN